MPPWHWLIIGGTGVLSAGLSLGVRRYVLTTNIGLSQPRERDVHTKPIPRLGGVAIGMSFLLVCIVLLLTKPDSVRFVPQTWLGVDRNLMGMILGVILLLVVGIIDDTRGMSPWTKLVFHFVAGIILASSGVIVTHLTNPTGGQIILGNLTYVIVVLWVVFMINVINFLDGLDGLAGGISLIATSVLYLLAIRPDINQPSMAVLAIVLIGALIGFLPFNFYPAKIFMGDSGSQVLGFLLAVFAIISGGKLATACLVLGVPILDVIWVITRRVVTKQPIYKADRFHLHHRLLRAGLSQREAVLLLYTISAAFGIVALQTQSLGKFIAVLALVGMMIIGGAVLVGVANLRESRVK